MTAKEYLSQAWRVDRMVNAKLKQTRTLRSQAELASSLITGIPAGGERAPHRMEAIIAKLLDLEAEIGDDIDTLVELKREIILAIKRVPGDEHRELLELRYLAFLPWSEIARDMRRSQDYVFELHRKALVGIKIPAEQKKPS
jgi:DNA-directed RNA polymerase specialized sigma subunit